MDVFKKIIQQTLNVTMMVNICGN